MSNQTNSVSPNDTIIIGTLEIMKNDLGTLTWTDAASACAALGDGWRLPTIDELIILETNKDKIGGFVNSLYWSSTEVAPANAYIQSFVEVKTANDDKNYLFHVRAVRSISTITINNLEVLSVDLATLEWDEAIKACEALGDGWRLPTVDELNMLFLNKDKIGGFVNSFYWGSTEIIPGSPCIQGFINGKQSKDQKIYLFHVRPVKSI
jgi:hypothetical protein